MSTEVHDTSLRSQEQDHAWFDSQWEEEVVSRLPEDLEAQAIQCDGSVARLAGVRAVCTLVSTARSLGDAH